MKTEFLFATPLIVVEPFRRQADVARLADTIRARSREDAGVTHSNDGGWQSGHDFLQWAGDEGKALAHALQQVANKASLDFSSGQLTRDSLKWKVTAWANINGKGMGNHAHYHPGAFWSACFYADDGGIAGGETLGGGARVQRSARGAPADVRTARENGHQWMPDCRIVGAVLPENGSARGFPFLAAPWRDPL